MSRYKIESARRQLGTALALYLRDCDPVSVHCLAGGGCEIIEYYAKKAGREPFISNILKAHPDLEIRKIRQLQRKYWTAFKHATHVNSHEERDDDRLLAQFSDEQNDHVLFIGWYDYASATQMMPVEAQVHQAWYLALHPTKLDQKHSLKPYENLFPDLRTKARVVQKQMLNAVIVSTRADKNVMADPRTDSRSLVLGWTIPTDLVPS